MQFTGERVIPHRPELKSMLQEHMARYQFIEPFAAGATVLDAGCGCGYGSYFLAKAGARYVIGGDHAPEAIEYACQHYSASNLDFEVIDITAMRFKENTFDLVVCMEVFEHIPNYEQLLGEMCRVLKPGGKLVISTPNKLVFSPKQEQPINTFHFREFFKDEFATLLSRYFSDMKFWSQTVNIPGIVPFIVFNMRIQRWLASSHSSYSRVVRAVYELAMKAFTLPFRLFPALIDDNLNVIVKPDELPLEKTFNFIAVGCKPEGLGIPDAS